MAGAGWATARPGWHSSRRRSSTATPTSTPALISTIISRRRRSCLRARDRVSLAACREEEIVKTELCERLGIGHPIFSVGFGAGAGPELVAAVSNAGALGVLGGAGGFPLPYLRQQIRRVRALTAKPFGVNLILAGITEGPLETWIHEAVPLLLFLCGDPRPYVEPA